MNLSVYQQKTTKKHRSDRMIPVCSLFFTALLSFSHPLVSMELKGESLKKQGFVPHRSNLTSEKGALNEDTYVSFKPMGPFQKEIRLLAPAENKKSIQSDVLEQKKKNSLMAEIALEKMKPFQVETKEDPIKKIYLAHLKSFFHSEILKERPLIVVDFGAGSGNLTFAFLEALQSFLPEIGATLSDMTIRMCPFEVDPLKKKDFKRRAEIYKKYEKIKYTQFGNIKNPKEFENFLRSTGIGRGMDIESVVFVMSHPSFLTAKHELLDGDFAFQQIKTTDSTVSDWRLSGFLKTVNKLINIKLSLVHYLLILPSDVETFLDKLFSKNKNNFTDGGVFKIEDKKNTLLMGGGTDSIDTPHSLYILGNQPIRNSIHYENMMNKVFGDHVFKPLYSIHYEHMMNKVFGDHVFTSLPQEDFDVPPHHHLNRQEIDFVDSVHKIPFNQMYQYKIPVSCKNTGNLFVFQGHDKEMAFTQSKIEHEGDREIFMHHISNCTFLNNWIILFSREQERFESFKAVKFKPLKFKDVLGSINFKVPFTTDNIIFRKKKNMDHSFLMDECEALGLSAYLNTDQVQKILIPEKNHRRHYFKIRNIGKVPLPSPDRMNYVGKGLRFSTSLGLNDFFKKSRTFQNIFFKNNEDLSSIITNEENRIIEKRVNLGEINKNSIKEVLSGYVDSYDKFNITFMKPCQTTNQDLDCQEVDQNGMVRSGYDKVKVSLNENKFKVVFGKK